MLKFDDDMKKKNIAIPIVMLVVLSSLALLNASMMSMSTESIESGIKYHSEVFVSVNGNLIDRSSNLFSNKGKNATKTALTSGKATTAFTVIAVGNNTDTVETGQANATNLSAEVTGSGLTRVGGTLRYNNTEGVYVVEHTFTVSGTTGTIRINATGLFNSTEDATAVYFAGNNFTNADLTNNDQLNITWVIAIS